MCELISGKEAKLAWASGETVQIKCAGGFFELAEHRELLNVFDNPENKFRLKPRTITINGIEVPAPFEPKRDQSFYVLNAFSKNGYQCFRLSDDYDSDFENALINFVWRTEEEIKQVVSALRSVFGKK